MCGLLCFLSCTKGRASIIGAVEQVLIDRFFIRPGVFGDQGSGGFGGEPRVAQVVGQRLPLGGGLCYCRAEEQHKFATLAVVILSQPGRGGGNAEMRNLFELFAQFAGDDERARTVEGFSHRGEGIADTVRRFKEDGGMGSSAVVVKKTLPLARFGGDETGEGEAVGGQAAGGKGGDDAAGAGQRADADIRCVRETGEQRTGIGDKRRAGIADKGDVFARLQAADKGFRRSAFVVLVQRSERAVNGVGVEQAATVARILAGYNVCRLQGRQRAPADVVQIAYRRGDDVQRSTHRVSFMFFAKLAPHLRRGRAGERRAATYLKAQGLVIVANNFRSRYGEIDLIARDGAELVFVEVRSREAGAQVSAAASISAAKREKIRKTAQVYLQQHYRTLPSCRFDAVCIDGADITWLRAAF